MTELGPIHVNWRWQGRPFWAHFNHQGQTIGVCRWTPGAARRRAEQLKDRRIQATLQAELEETEWKRRHKAQLRSLERTLGIKIPRR